MAAALAVLPQAAAAADGQRISDCLVNPVHGSAAALAGVALLIGLFVAPEALAPPPATGAPTGVDSPEDDSHEWARRALGVPPVPGELGQEPRSGAEALPGGTALTGDEMALAHGGGAFGDDVVPYRPRGPVRGQTSPDSSLAASCRMVHNSVTGTDIPEPMWRTAARVDETGGRLAHATHALRVSNA